MITIRPYKKQDFRFVQDICVATSKHNDNQTERALVCSLYCDYYVNYEPEHCFVAVDENDEPIGYILCAANLDLYDEQMTENILPLVRKISGSDFFHFNAEQKVEQRYIKQGYTAHLHIDILEDYRRQGVGTQLVNTLLEKLTADFVEGVHLLCDSKNKPAIEFYTKLGFEDIDYLSGLVVFGKKLFSEDE